MTRLQRTLYAAHMNVAQHTWEEGNIQRVQELLEEHRPKAGESDLRGFEWYYLDRLCHAEILSIKDMGGAVFSPDGTRLASTINRGPGTSPQVKVWDAQTGRELLALEGGGGRQGLQPGRQTAGHWRSRRQGAPGQDVGCPDRTGTDDLQGAHRPCLQPGLQPGWHTPGQHHQQGAWHISSGEGVGCPDRPGDPLHQRPGEIGLQPGRQTPGLDERERAGRADPGREGATRTGPGGAPGPGPGPTGVKVWDAQTGQEIFSIKGEGRWVFSPDGKRLASPSADKTVKLWDAQTGQEILSLKGHTNQVETVAFSPDGTRLASTVNRGMTYC